MIRKYMVLFIVFLSACASPPLADPTPTDMLNYPISVELSKNEDYLFVANTNFDLHYRNASLNVINLDDRKIEKNSTVLTDAFLGDIVIDYSENLLFTTSREKNKLYLVDISNSSNLDCSGEKIEAQDGDAEFCNNKDFVLDLKEDAPNSLAIDVEKNLIYVGHRNLGTISIIRYNKAEKRKMVLLKQFKIAGFLGDISSLKYSAVDDKVYVTSNYSSFLYTFRPMFDFYNRVGSIKYFDKSRISNRNVAYTPSSESMDSYKDKIFVTTTSPQGVSVLEKKGDSYVFVKSIPTIGAPVKIRCIENNDICILAMYDAKSISIIDAKSNLLTHNIKLKKRVYDFTYSEKRKEIYTTLFLENGVMVIDMDESSSSYLKIKEVISNE